MKNNDIFILIIKIKSFEDFYRKHWRIYISIIPVSLSKGKTVRWLDFYQRFNTELIEKDFCAPQNTLSETANMSFTSYTIKTIKYRLIYSIYHSYLRFILSVYLQSFPNNMANFWDYTFLHEAIESLANGLLKILT